MSVFVAQHLKKRQINKNDKLIATSNHWMSPELPPELWVTILSHLQYYDMKMCWMNNKGFKKLIDAHEELRSVIFRSTSIVKASQPLSIDLGDLVFHPAINEIGPFCRHDDQMVLAILSWTCNKAYPTFTHFKLGDSTMCYEFATNPPLEYLRYRIYDWPIQEIQRSGGIKVYDMVKELGLFFRRSIGPGVKLTFYDLLGDRTGWCGWEYAKKDDNGRLLLHSPHFDS